MKRTLQPLPKRKVTWQVEVDESERLRNALRVVVKLRAAARYRPAQLRGAQTAVHGERANLTGLVLGCIEAKICK